MGAERRINKAFKSAAVVEFDDSSKIVILSDIHRGVGDNADDFRFNKNIFTAALRHYYKNGYTYIELGDGDELWENDSFAKIAEYNRDMFKLIDRFNADGRCYIIYGNHDIDKRSPSWVEKNLHYLSDNQPLSGSQSRKITPLLPNVKVYESVILKDTASNRQIFLLHGHQADFLNDNLWRLSKFLVRFLWRPLESIGIRNPTSASQNPTRRNSVETHLINYAKRNNIMLIAGHTHRYRYPKPSSALYFNDGCCINTGFITAFEVSGGAISLVKWSVNVNDDDVLQVERTILEGPISIEEFYASEKNMEKILHNDG